MAFMTPNNIDLMILAILIGLALFEVGKSVFRYIAGKTSNTYDDKIIAFIDSVEGKLHGITESEWVIANAPKFWAFVENLSKTNVPTLKGVQKLATAFTIAHAAYDAAKGKTLSADGLKLLETELAKRSAADKAK